MLTVQEIRSFPDAGKIEFVSMPARPLDEVLSVTSGPLLELVEGMLRLSPTRRISAEAALQSTWFDKTLVPLDFHAWQGHGLRVDYTNRCVDGVGASRLVDLLAHEFDQARDRWPEEQ